LPTEHIMYHFAGMLPRFLPTAAAKEWSQVDRSFENRSVHRCEKTLNYGWVISYSV
jgi:hypothetical protein